MLNYVLYCVFVLKELSHRKDDYTKEREKIDRTLEIFFYSVKCNTIILDL
jgi:hypothetical protein